MTSDSVSKLPQQSGKPGAFEWVKAIRSAPKDVLPSSARLVAFVLSSYMDARSGDSCFPSLATIERDSGLSHATVLKMLAVLEKSGYLTRHRSRGGQRANGAGYPTHYEARVPAQVVNDQPVSPEPDAQVVNDARQVVNSVVASGQPLTTTSPKNNQLPKNQKQNTVTNYSKSSDPQAVGVDVTEEQQQPQPRADEHDALTPASDEEPRGDADAFAEIMSAVDDGKISKAQVMRLAVQVVNDSDGVSLPSSFYAVKELPDDALARMGALVPR